MREKIEAPLIRPSAPFARGGKDEFFGFGGIMTDRPISGLDRALARICENCPVCRRARRTQHGVAFTLVKQVEVGLCPFCKAYERVHGRKAHEDG